MMRIFSIEGELKVDPSVDNKELVIRIMRGLKREGIHFEGFINEINNKHT